MKLLLDTQCWLWWFTQLELLNQAAIVHIADETNELWLSVASIWEMGIKVAIKKLPLVDPLDSYISSQMTVLAMRRRSQP
ncbi:type II toxin-antitoxin system VapC family toxin [Nostoc sp.]|uniref:type II toxin-antitoxin system VapC family toxin n=1 Tax=Nostoc sp. TaxID=1180 RepID=UPI002FFC4399